MSLVPTAFRRFREPPADKLADKSVEHAADGDAKNTENDCSSNVHEGPQS